MRGKNISAEDLTAKKELALEVIRRLKAEYPDAGCTLDYDHAWQLLVSVRLAAQCTDARVNIVVQDLFAKYPSVAALAEAEPEDIEVYSRENLLKLVWGTDYPGDVRTVDVHIRRLREKIELSPSEPRYVHTKWGVGYYFNDKLSHGQNA